MQSYAIVDVAGSQVKMTADGLVRVPLLEGDVGSRVSLEKVLLWNDGKAVHVGRPYVEGKAVTAEIVRHGKDRKIVVFKKKRRKNYRRTTGHRQQFTELRVTGLPG